MRPCLGLVLASLWIGASMLLATSVAPVVFGTLPSHELAGAVIGQVLRPVFVSGVVGGLIVAGVDLQGGSAARRQARVGFAVAWAVACGIAGFVMTPRIDALRRTIGVPIDTLAHDDVRRLAFGRMHAEIVAVFCVALIAAVVVVVLQVVAARPRLAPSSLTS